LGRVSGKLVELGGIDQAGTFEIVSLGDGGATPTGPVAMASIKLTSNIGTQTWRWVSFESPPNRLNLADVHRQQPSTYASAIP
jgi:hypothetical protein